MTKKNVRVKTSRIHVPESFAFCHQRGWKLQRFGRIIGSKTILKRHAASLHLTGISSAPNDSAVNNSVIFELSIFKAVDCAKRKARPPAYVGLPANRSVLASEGQQDRPSNAIR